MALAHTQSYRANRDEVWAAAVELASSTGHADVVADDGTRTVTYQANMNGVANVTIGVSGTAKNADVAITIESVHPYLLERPFQEKLLQFVLDNLGDQFDTVATKPSAPSVQQFLHRVAASSTFTQVITTLIIINCILIGVEIDYDVPVVASIQSIILAVFTMEILVRWLASPSTKAYLSHGWNLFDIALVAITYVPTTWIESPELLTSFRILRVLRVFRLMKAFPELQVITKVLVKSMSSLAFVSLLMLIVMYMYSITGVILFRGQSRVITGVGDVGDPFGSVSESMFSMFRVLTGEDWTDLRYDLILGKPKWYKVSVTFFFVSFVIFSAFLLVNLIVGAVCNNYDSVMSAQDSIEHKEEPSA